MCEVPSTTFARVLRFTEVDVTLGRVEFIPVSPGGDAFKADGKDFFRVRKDTDGIGAES